MKQYSRPEIVIRKFETTDAFAATGDSIFGAGSGTEEIPVSEYTYDAANSTLSPLEQLLNLFG